MLEKRGFYWEFPHQEFPIQQANFHFQINAHKYQLR